MTDSPNEPFASDHGAGDGDDVYGISWPADRVTEDVRQPAMMRREPVVTFEPPPPAPRRPFVTGVFAFLFYLKTLAVWLLGSIGLMIGLLLCLYCMYLVEIGLTVAARCLAVPSLWLAAFPLGYLSVCCLNVIEQTSQGYDKIEDWSVGEWREWFWSFGFTLGAIVPALLIGAVVGAIPWVGTGLSMGLTVFLLYPVFLLSALDNGSIFAPISGLILRSFRTAWQGWLIFYGETSVLVAALVLLILVLFPLNPFLAVAVTTPPLVAVMLIYARLLGRLVWYIGQSQEE